MDNIGEYGQLNAHFEEKSFTATLVIDGRGCKGVRGLNVLTDGFSLSETAPSGVDLVGSESPETLLEAP